MCIENLILHIEEILNSPKQRRRWGAAESLVTEDDAHECLCSVLCGRAVLGHGGERFSCELRTLSLSRGSALAPTWGAQSPLLGHPGGPHLRASDVVSPC